MNNSLQGTQVQRQSFTNAHHYFFNPKLLLKYIYTVNNHSCELANSSATLKPELDHSNTQHIRADYFYTM